MVKNSSESCLTSILDFQSEMKILQAKHQFTFAKYVIHIPFFGEIDRNLWLNGCSKLRRVGRDGLGSSKELRLSVAPRPFLRSTERPEPVSGLTASLYILCCSFYSVFVLESVACRCDRVLALRMNIRLLLFWST